MKQLMHNLFYFSFPEKRALIVFITVWITLYSVHEVYYLILPSKSYDLSLYAGLFESDNESDPERFQKTDFTENKFAKPVLHKINRQERSGFKPAFKYVKPENTAPEKGRSGSFDERSESHFNKKVLVSDSIIIDPKKKKIMVDVNTAEEYELQYINGIGPAFASRIIKYRNMLGGFFKTEQLMEVYGIDSTKYNQIKHQLFITGSVKKLPLDQENPPFFNHPYLTRMEAKIIRAYVLQHGPLQKPEDLLKIKIMSKETLDKIKPYLISGE